MNVIKSNYHTHTEHCRHAEGLPEDYAAQAIKCGLEILGMSDHAPFKNQDYGYRMPYNELDSYCEQVLAVKEKFAGRLTVFNSLEIEYLPEYTKGSNYYEFLFKSKKMDYLLLGEHFFRDRNGHIHNVTCLENTELAIDYALACREAMETGYFKILAHPDLFCINEQYPWNSDYEKACDILVEASEKNRVILEYNANGVRRGEKNYPDGKRLQYPHIKFWEKVRNANIPAIVGSDAHTPSMLWDEAVENSIKFLDKMGIKRIAKLDL